MANSKAFFAIIGLLVLVTAALSLFRVMEWEKAILFRLGEIRQSEFDPGLHFKIPLINNIRTFDGRTFTQDVEPERFLTVEKKNVIVDSFIMWRIADVKRYYTAVAGDERNARLRLEQVVKDAMRGEFGKRTINEVVSGERVLIMNDLTEAVNRQAQQIGIEIVDVRIKRIDLPTDVNESVYRRMQAERSRVAKEFRSRGQEEAEKIRANADRERSVMLAEAYRQAEEIRGEGDARAAELYAEAYSEDEDFYAFLRSLNAYRRSFDRSGDILLLDPDNEFFKYFNEAQGAKGSGATP